MKIHVYSIRNLTNPMVLSSWIARWFVSIIESLKFLTASFA